MDWTLNRHEMNDAFLAFTGICLCVSLITLIILFCVAKCTWPNRRRRKGTKGGGVEAGRKRSSKGAAFNSKSETVALSAESVEWIDERNTDLVSSTIKVQSLHATNSQLNNLMNSSNNPTKGTKANK